MTLTIAVFVYAAAMTMANLSVATWGPWVSPINAFVLIGLDLALRDWLHVRLKTWQMGALIASTGLLTYVLNPAAGMIAVASACAFSAAALVDWVTFARLRGSWLFRANGSNVAGAAVDSLIFPTLAFGALMPHIVLLQFVVKVCGGAIWAALLARTLRREAMSYDGEMFKKWREARIKFIADNPATAQALALKVPSPIGDEHIASEHCWCGPEAAYTAPETGATVYVHRRVQ